VKRSNEDGALPRAALLGAGFLVIGSLCLVSVARLTGYKPERPAPSVAVASYDLRFEDRPDGSVAVYNSAENRMVDFLPPGTNGFVRGVLRGLVRGRKAESIDATPPFRLTRWADGRLSLDDPSTGRHVDLEVFGPTNAAAFADILVASGRPKDQS
jgi:putative photosynthetic complex assembly protein